MYPFSFNLKTYAAKTEIYHPESQFPGTSAPRLSRSFLHKTLSWIGLPKNKKNKIKKKKRENDKEEGKKKEGKRRRDKEGREEVVEN